jgi:hypothetical protein
MRTTEYVYSIANSIMLKKRHCKCRLTGGSYEKIIPEFYIENLTTLKEGAILKIYDENGNIIKTFKLKQNENIELIWILEK